MTSRYHLATGKIHTLLTHSFTQLQFFHLFSNCLGIYFIGSNIEKIFGARKFLNLYIGGAIAGAIF